MIAECKSEKKTIAIDSRFVKLIQRIMQLSDGRFMITLTKSGNYLDLSITSLGNVERIS